jgi:hypothetical protein
MTTPVTKGAAPDDAPRILFRCPELAALIEASYEDADLDLDRLETVAFTFTPVT